MNDLVIFYPVGHQAHFEIGHPERPERIEVVRDSLKQAGLWESYQKIAPVPLTETWLATVHDPGYLTELKRACQNNAHLDLDTFTTTASWDLALNAAGGTAAVAEAIWRGVDQAEGIQRLRGFSLSRPPGHHAERARGMGFCLLNNIAIAAEYLLTADLPGIRNAERVAIVDLDLHHGNGTQDIFWQRKDVLFISTHQSPLYPGTGMLEEMGAGPGYGYTVNLPLPPATGDVGYQAAMKEIILPLLSRYKPEILLVSLGFDPHWRDPLGHLLLSVAGYASLVKSLVEWADQNCQGRISLIMEGGYDSISVAACALASVAVLLGEPVLDPIGPSPRPEGHSWQTVVKRAKSIWELS